MITVYWFSNGVRVASGTHHAHDVTGDCVSKSFGSIDEALKELKPTNRAVPILKYMQETCA